MWLGAHPLLIKGWGFDPSFGYRETSNLWASCFILWGASNSARGI